MRVLPQRTSPGSADGAFTLVEMMVSMGVLALIMILISQLFNSATAITSMGNMRMDADSQARAVFDRMAIDFAQIVKRSDVDYYLKDSTNNFAGNDQIAFYSQVPGYFISSASAAIQSPVSLVAYRVNSGNSPNNPYFNQLQRYGYGLSWNGSGTNPMPVVFSGSSTSSGTNTITSTWPNAVSMAADPNYESIGPDVFRFEYYYLLKGTTGAAPNPSIVSDTPWDTRAPTNHTSVNGLQDVAAIVVAIAVVDPRSRRLVTPGQIATLSTKLVEFSNDMNPGDLEYKWQTAINDPTNGVPRIAASAIRVYSRHFYLPQSITP